MQGQIPSRLCRPCRSDFSVVFSETPLDTGQDLLERPPWRAFHPQAQVTHANNWFCSYNRDTTEILFRDRDGRVCFLAHSVISLIIVKTNFYQSSVLKRSFQRCVRRCNFQFLILKLPLFTCQESREFPKFSHLQIAFLKRFFYVFFYLSIQGVFHEIFGRFDLFIAPGMHTHKF